MVPLAESQKGSIAMRLYTAHDHCTARRAGITLALALVLTLSQGAAGAQAARARPQSAACGARATGSRIGDCAATFALPDAHGRTIALTRYRGHPVLLNFWGAGCPYCALELPDLQAFATTFLRRGGVILGVDVAGDARDVVAGYARDNSVAWPLLVDPPTRVGDLYGVRGTPTNVFIDRRGVIRAIVNGPLTAQEFRARSRGL
jgi:peroxiredoxin